MFKDAKAYSSFSVTDIESAKEFYSQTLGLEIEQNEMGMLVIKLANSASVMAYPKDDHVPATFTVLNFIVDNIDQTVDAMKDKNITFEHYDGMTDEKGVARGITAGRGPDIAWFKDPAGNVLAVLQEK